MPTTTELVEIFRQGNLHLSEMVENLDFPWTPGETEPRRLHNLYARCLITSYVSKFTQLSDGLLYSYENQKYLIYAQTGRALIELTATLRYYVVTQYMPILDKGSVSREDMQKLLEIDLRHLGGGRFDWKSFVFEDYEKLTKDCIDKITSKRRSNTDEGPEYIEQVNVKTCIDKWALKEPGVMIAYDLFCDLVHPNIGSSFLVSSANKNGLYFSTSKGVSVGIGIFEQSFPLLLSITAKVFGDYLAVMMGTIWHDDQL